MGHSYSDNCTCGKCTATFNRAVFAVVVDKVLSAAAERHEEEKKKKKKKT